MTRSRGGALAAASLAALVAVTFGQALSPARVFYQRDVHSFGWAHAAALDRAAAERAWLWNPWEGFGAPLLADPNFQLTYPPTWAVLPLDVAVRYKVLTLGHALLGALGACALARRLGLGWAAAAVGGAAYALAGPILSAASLWHHYAGAAWLPWLLFALEGLLRRPGLAAALPLGIVGGLQLAAGSGDLCLAAALLGSARLAWHVAHGRPPARRVLALAAGGGAAATLAFALGAAQWLPTAELARQGFRAALDPRAAAYWSVHPATLADLAVPRLASELPLSPASRQALYEGREPFLGCLYLGVVALALAALGLVLRPRVAAGPAAAAVGLVAIALGRHGPVHGLLLALPGFASMRYPPKFLWPAALAVAVLAAIGASAWESPWSTAERRRARAATALLLAAAAAAIATAWWVAGPPRGLASFLAPAEAALGARAAALKLARSALLLLLVGLLAWRRAGGERAGRRATAALLVLGAADLVVVGSGVNPLAPRELLDHRPAVLDRLGSGRVRLHSAVESLGCLAPGTRPAGWSPGWIAALAFEDALRPPSAGRWGLDGSYDGEFTGLGSRWTAEFTAAARSRLGTPAGLRLLQVGGVTHVLRVGRAPVPGLGPAQTLPSPYVCPLQVQRVPEPLPRAYVARGERAAADPPSVVRLLLDPAFDPRREVLLDAASPTSTAAASPGEARVVSRRLDTLELEAELRAPGVLVVLESFDPGWGATVDGAPVPVLRANGLFRGVRLGAGRHRVRLAYRPRSAELGSALALLGLCAAAAGVALRVARARRCRAAARSVA